MNSTDLYASLTAGAVAEFMVLPICTIQTLYQTQQKLDFSRKSVYQITKELYTNHGISSFYNASASGILSQMVSTASKFTLYKTIQSYRRTSNIDLKNNIVNGFVAGILSIPFTQPFDVLKNYHQRQKSIIHDFKKNPLILYRGTKQSIGKSAILIGALYPVNDFCRSYINFSSGYDAALSALATTIIISPIIHPIDLLKRRAMAGEKLWMGFNITNYYRGLVINWCRATPHFVVTMVVIDIINNKLNNYL